MTDEPLPDEPLELVLHWCRHYLANQAQQAIVCWLHQRCRVVTGHGIADGRYAGFSLVLRSRTQRWPRSVLWLLPGYCKLIQNSLTTIALDYADPELLPRLQQLLQQYDIAAAGEQL